MRQKLAKKLAKYARENQDADWIKFQKMIKGMSFGERWTFAWWVLFGKGISALVIKR